MKLKTNEMLQEEVKLSNNCFYIYFWLFVGFNAAHLIFMINMSVLGLLITKVFMIYTAAVAGYCLIVHYGELNRLETRRLRK